MVEIGGRTQERVVPAGGVVIVGAEPIDWLRVDQPSELIEVSASQAVRRALADELRAEVHSDLADLSFASDAVIWSIAARLRSLVRRVISNDSLEADWLVCHLYGHVLVTRFGGRIREKGDGALDPRRMARVAEYVEAHLGDPLSLNVLANVAALSEFHFQRSFRRATGCSPHRYVAMKRAEEASRRLASGNVTASVVAALGYRDSRSLLRAVSEDHGSAKGSIDDAKN